MLIVIPFCHKDARGAVKLLEWMFELDGQQTRHRCLVVAACGTSGELAVAVELEARKAFVTAKLVRTMVPDERGWPKSCNTLFTCAATYVNDNLKCPFWWNEVDCIPTKPKWLDTLEDEYVRARKPFMGAIVNEPLRHLTGCAIYPHDIPFYNRFMLGMMHENPWDCIGPEYTIPHTHHTNLVQHRWSDPLTKQATTFKDKASLSALDPNAVVFHRNKDHTLIDQLRKPSDAIVIEPAPEPLVPTVVITNFKRPDFLWKAFESCRAAKVEKIVVTSSGTTSEVEAVHKRIKAAQLSTVVVTESGDSGCNMNWLRGIEAAKSKWVTILHDDDLLTPDFAELPEHNNSLAGFYLWDARRHGMGFNDIYPTLERATGHYSSFYLFRNLLVPNGFTLSPTIGCFQRDDLLATLGECQKNFGPEFHLRPTMMVGNDLMIWLRSIEKHRHFGYIKQTLTSYGHHEESTTCRDVFQKEGRLAPIYNRTREYFAKTFRKIVHVTPYFKAEDKQSVRRNEFAEKSWLHLHRSGLFDYRPMIMGNRNSSEIGDSRRLPFLKDVLKAGMENTNPKDIILFTNNDTVLHQDTAWVLLDMMRTEDACCAFRKSYNIPAPSLVTYTKINEHDPGRDLFAFTSQWLKDNWHYIPDYVLGSSDWDSTMSSIIRLTKGMTVTPENWLESNDRCEFPGGLVWHEAHLAKWSTKNNRKTMEGNIYNRKLTKNFAREHGNVFYI